MIWKLTWKLTWKNNVVGGCGARSKQPKQTTRGEYVQCSLTLQIIFLILNDNALLRNDLQLFNPRPFARESNLFTLRLQTSLHVEKDKRE